MKIAVFVFLFAFVAVESRKIVQISKNANIDFINMEMGGTRPNGGNVARISPGAVPSSPNAGVPGPSNAVAGKVTTAAPVVKPVPTPSPTPAKPVTPAQVPHQPPPPSPTQPKPAQAALGQPDLKPVPSKPAAPGSPTTPGYGNVKQLVNFYDSQGKASAIRPYSYSQAVKQG